MFGFVERLMSPVIPVTGLSPNMYWLLLKIIFLSCITRLTLNLWYGRFDFFFFFFFSFDVHESITITLLTVSCQKLLEYRLLTYCSRESGYSLDRDGFPGLQAQSLASVKSLVFTVLPIDLQLSLFLWLCERTTKWQSRKTETDGGDEWST